MNDSDRVVVFIGGTSYSGSTLLDLILGNSENAFSCGEVSQLFHPVTPNHLRVRCSCGEGCPLWTRWRADNAQRLYHNIFADFPNVRFIIDSSKDPLWIAARTRDLHEAGVSVRNVLIWKTLEEYSISCNDRGRTTRIRAAWTNYHRHYFASVKQWIGIHYADLVDHDAGLISLCQALGMDYFESKRSYWQRPAHLLFGNHSARRHLYEEGSEAYVEAAAIQDLAFRPSTSGTTRLVAHRSRTPVAKPGPKPAANPVRADAVALAIKDVLSANSIPHNQVPPMSWSASTASPQVPPELSAPASYIAFKRAQKQVRELVTRWRGLPPA